MASMENGEQKEQPKQKKQPKLENCPDCVRNGVSTGLRDANTLCPTCDGSGSVKAVV